MGVYKNCIEPFLMWPPLLAGYDFLLDPSQQVTLDANQRVQQIVDLAGGLVGAQPSATNRPFMDALKGLPVLEFPAEGANVLDFGNVLNIGTGSVTFLVVGLNRGNSSGQGTYYAKSVRTASNNRYMLENTSVASNLSGVYQDTAIAHATAVSYAPHVQKKWSVVGQRIDRVTKENSVWGRGVKLEATTITQPDTYSFTSSFKFLVGGHLDSNATSYDTTRFLNGSLAWLVRYPFALTDEQMANESQKLSQKFNI